MKVKIPEHTHQGNLRCGTVATLSTVKNVGEFCWLGQIGGEVHSWRIDGRWSADGIAHPFDLISIHPLKR